MCISDFDAAAVVAKAERYAPRIFAFVGKRAAQEVLGGRVGYGPQETRDRPQRSVGGAVDVGRRAGVMGHRAVAGPGKRCRGAH